ncbi:hypothetical protein BH23ACT5_BH23ACT5_03000 [soil metagenome]
MIVTVTITVDGGPRTYTGHVVCRGPGTMDMLLTEPFALAGRTVQFPLASVISEVRSTNADRSVGTAASA